MFVATERRRSALLVPFWGLAITAIYAQAIYQRAYLTLLDYVFVAVICAVGGAITMDIGRALLSFLGAMALGTIILYGLVSYPASASTLPSPADILFSYLWINAIFTYIFPIPFAVFLVASIVGAGLGEKYFS
jgi:hypothetical protein